MIDATLAQTEAISGKNGDKPFRKEPFLDNFTFLS
jgi:hypothetical protein